MVRCVMDPDMNDAQTLFSCMSALERQMRQVPHIMDLVLYPVDSGVVCSARTGVTDFSNYSESEMIRTYLDTRELVYQKDQSFGYLWRNWTVSTVLSASFFIRRTGRLAF